MKENNEPLLEPMKVKCALKSEMMKLNYRKTHKPSNVNILDSTIIRALEKQIPQVPINRSSEYNPRELVYPIYHCSYCDKGICGYDEYCSNCGQRIDWEEE